MIVSRAIVLGFWKDIEVVKLSIAACRFFIETASRGIISTLIIRLVLTYLTMVFPAAFACDL